jgi:inner membrane protein
MSDVIDPIVSAIRNSHVFRLFVVGVLVVVLQIPVLMIGGLVSERKDRHQEAIKEVSSKW